MNLICYYSQSSSPDDHAARVEKLIVQCESGEKLKLNRQTDDISNKKNAVRCSAIYWRTTEVRASLGTLR